MEPESHLITAMLLNRLQRHPELSVASTYHDRVVDFIYWAQSSPAPPHKSFTFAIYIKNCKSLKNTFAICNIIVKTLFHICSKYPMYIQRYVSAEENVQRTQCQYQG